MPAGGFCGGWFFGGEKRYKDAVVSVGAFLKGGKEAFRGQKDFPGAKGGAPGSSRVFVFASPALFRSAPSCNHFYPYLPLYFFRQVATGRLYAFHSSKPPSSSITGKPWSAKNLAADVERWQTSE